MSRSSKAAHVKPAQRPNLFKVIPFPKPCSDIMNTGTLLGSSHPSDPRSANCSNHSNHSNLILQQPAAIIQSLFLQCPPQGQRHSDVQLLAAPMISVAWSSRTTLGESWPPPIGPKKGTGFSMSCRHQHESTVKIRKCKESIFAPLPWHVPLPRPVVPSVSPVISCLVILTQQTIPYLSHSFPIVSWFRGKFIEMLTFQQGRPNGPQPLLQEDLHQAADDVPLPILEVGGWNPAVIAQLIGHRDKAFPRWNDEMLGKCGSCLGKSRNHD